MPKKKSHKSYDGGPVGYSKPPAEYQFPKGGKKPPGSGRRKGAKNNRTLIEEIDCEEQDVTIGGSRRKLTKKEIFLRQAHQQALTGSIGDKIKYLRLCEMLAPGSADPPLPIQVESIPGDEGL